jgi:hypothetical protein
MGLPSRKFLDTAPLIEFRVSRIRRINLLLNSFRPITASRQNRATLSVWRLRAQSHSNLMQSGMWLLRRETQQIAAVQMIRKVVHSHFEFLLGCEQLVFPASHGRNRAWNIFLPGLHSAV